MEITKKDLVPLLLLPVIWGCYYVASQQWVGFTSTFISGLGIRLVTLVLLTIIMCSRHEMGLLLKTGCMTYRLVIIGIFGFLLDFTAFIGLSLSSAASGTALLKCDVLMVNVMSVIIYKERFTWKSWLWTIVMLIGVFMVMGVDFRHFQITDPGNIFFLLSAFFVSCNAFIIKSVQKNDRVPVCDDVIAYFNNFVTMVIFFAASLITGSLRQFAVLGENIWAAAALGISGIGQTLIYVVYYHNLRTYPVWLVKIFLLFMPVVTTFITFTLFGEVMIIEQYLGIAVLIAGAVGILLEQRTPEENKNKM